MLKYIIYVIHVVNSYNVEPGDSMEDLACTELKNLLIIKDNK